MLRSSPSSLSIGGTPCLRCHCPPLPRTRTLLAPSLRCRAFRWSRPSTLCCCRSARASPGDVRAADAVLVAVVKHASAIAVEPPPISSLANVAMRSLRRSALLKAQFTFHTWHGAPLRRAFRVCSRTCILLSLCGVCRLSCVCSKPAIVRGAVVPNRHYSGTALNSAVPALLRVLSVCRYFTGTIPAVGTVQPAL